MQKERIYIKNMVCPRCIRVVREDLEKLGAQVELVELGSAILNYDPSLISKATIRKTLQSAGFELLEEAESQLVEKIKLAIQELIDNEGNLGMTNSDFISKKCGKNYNFLSKLFSAQEGNTIEQYTINQKILKVKELIKYDQLSLKEIAFRLNYSSSAYLSNQFKQMTGIKISDFKKSLKT